MVYDDFAMLATDILVSLRNRIRSPRSRSIPLDEGLALTTQVEKLRYLINEGRREVVDDRSGLFDRIQSEFQELVANNLFRQLGELRVSSIPQRQNRVSIAEMLGHEATYYHAIDFLATSFNSIPVQQTIDFGPSSAQGAARLRQIVPEQKIAPAQFAIVDHTLVVVSQEAKVDAADAANAAAARNALKEQGERILKSFERVNTDPRLKETLLALQTALEEGKDIIKLGMLTMTCEHVIIGVEEQISSTTAQLLRAHTGGLRLYLAQFPEWERFSKKSELTSLPDHDVDRLLEAAGLLVQKLGANENVHPDVPRVIAFVRDMAATPSAASRKAAFALLRTLENLISKIFSYASQFVDQVVTKTSAKVSGAIAVGLAGAILASTMNLTAVFSSIPESAWVPDATKIVEQYVMGTGVN